MAVMRRLGGVARGLMRTNPLHPAAPQVKVRDYQVRKC
jgi:hypothetical protein